MSNTSGYQDEIAVIGMACRFPGARNIDEFWQNLRDGREAISFFSEEELLASGEERARLQSINYVPAAPVLEDIELFDASFFGYTPREAEILDPQQRIFLECAWETLESAGYDPEQAKRRIGIFAGGSISNYLLFNLLANRKNIDTVGYLPVLLGNDKDYLASRTAYKLNLRGPAISVSTACSTSLVAIHLACQSLLSGESDMCLAGGVSLKIPHRVGYLYQEGGIFSPDGHCRAFDAKAQGTVTGSGVGIVLLKRLVDAMSDGDCVHAIIKGSAINNDGSLKVGYTAPGVQGQAQVVAEAQAIAGVEPESITYIETHGTATALGDPIEIAALTQVFRARTEKKGFCALGSVKTNIGHLDAGAGVAGFIKTVLALKHREIPASLHFENPNPKIDFTDSPFYVNASLTPWQRDTEPLCAGVSSFGIGGTNVHVVLEEAPHAEVPGVSREWQLLLLSARTSSALESTSENLARYLKLHPDFPLADIAYTYQSGRRAFSYRRMIVFQNLDDVMSVLEGHTTRRTSTEICKPGESSVVFMFPGGGTQYANMGLELYQQEQTFREHIDHCSDLLKPQLGIDLRKVLYPEGADAEAAAHVLRRPALALPALFATEYALAQLWMSWGIRPRAMIGHSLGEYVAACLAGVFSLEDALALVTLRGRLFEKLPEGAMLSVGLSAEELQPLLTSGLSLAAINTPSQCVVAGPKEAIDNFLLKMVAMGIEGRRVHIDVAAHSEMVEPILSAFRQFLHKVHLNSPQIPFASNVTGTWITGQEALNPDYWVRHLRQTVRFADGLSVIAASGRCVMLEIGPGRALTTFARKQFGVETDHSMLPSLRHPQDADADLAFLLHTCGQLWCSGVSLDWDKFSAHEKRSIVPLPTYPFERERYWIDAKPEQATDIKSLVAHKNADISDWFYVPSWKRSALSVLPSLAVLSKKKRYWLLFVDNMQLGASIAKKLEHLHDVVITVSAADRFCKINNRVYTLNPQQSADYDALLQELLSERISLTHIVHLWTVVPVEQEKEMDDLASLDMSLALGFYSLLFLMQALSRRNIVQPLKLTIISNNLQEVTGGEIRRPERAPILGHSKIIPCEFENVTCQTIDVVLPAAEIALDALVNQLTVELCQSTRDQQVAYRGMHRWVQTVESFPFYAREDKTHLRERGVYLITGGLGGIGFVLATYLAQSVHARLVLTSRQELPAREDWEQWLAQDGGQSEMAARLQQIRMLEDLGAEVLFIRADVTDYEQMQSAFEQIYERFGVLHGVVHAAGVPSGNIIQLLTPGDTASVLAPKVRGTLILAALLKNASLDFFVLCSALYSITGGFGQVDHCAANAFLDSFAFYHTATSHSRTLSINWDAWAEVGQAAALARRLQLARQSATSTHPEERKYQSGTEVNLVGTILPQDGVEAFQRILAQATIPQVIVSTRDVHTLQVHAKELFTMFMESPDEQEKNGTGSPQVQATYLAPRGELEKGIQSVWQMVLGLNKISIHDNFFEIGGDSVMILQMIKLIHDRFQVTLPMHLFFRNPTIAGLAEVVNQLQMEAISEDKMAELIRRVSQMSEKDVMEQLGKS